MSSLYKSKSFWITGLIFLFLFAILFSIRTGLFQKTEITSASIKILDERDTWMNIFQKDRKIGFSHSIFSKKEDGYALNEKIFMRVNTMGVAQDVHLNTEALLNSDFSMASIHFDMASGAFRFEAEGKVMDNKIAVTLKSLGSVQNIDIPLEKKPYLISGILDASHAAQLQPGDSLSFDIFEPSNMSSETAVIQAVAKEKIKNMGKTEPAVKMALSLKGMTQFAWISENGEVIKEEGLLGIRSERTTREDALFGLALQSSEDFTKTASVPSNIRIEHPDQLNMLELKLSGISNYEGLEMNQGARQSFKDHILTIYKESLPETQDLKIPIELNKFLKSSPLIQSDHKNIQRLLKKIVSPDDLPLDKVRKILNWLHKNIEKKPVLSIPDAISTLENRMGDCNEHSMLFAALARAAGIPAKVAAGLVYSDGRFFYHAWNLFYVGKWITADAIFKQLPADVTHISFATGELDQQLALVSIVGKINLTIIEYE